MFKNPFNRFLREEAAELTTGGGAATLEPAAAADTPEAGAEGSPEGEEAAVPAARKPSTLEKAQAAFQSKAGLLARANDAEKALEEATGTIATLRTDKATLEGQLAVLTADLAAARQELSDIAALLDGEKAQAKAAEERALDIVAGAGMKADALPAAEKEGDTVEDLTARMAAEKDVSKRWELSRQISAKRWESN